MRGRSALVGLAAAIGAAAFLFACTEIYFPGPTGPSGGGPVVIVTQNQGSHNGDTPASTAPGGGSGAIYKVKVGFYGGTCPSGPMVAGQTQLQVGCSGDMTATPKVQLPEGGDRDATVLEHGDGDDVVWAADIGPDVVVCVTSPANGFNRSCAAKKAGPWRQCAVVKGVKGCAEGSVS